MAEAGKKTRTVTTTDVTLTLSTEEAETLMAVLGSVAGDGRHSPRKHTDAMYSALRRAGVETGFEFLGHASHPARLVTGDLRFDSTPTKVRRATETPEFLRKLEH